MNRSATRDALGRLEVIEAENRRLQAEVARDRIAGMASNGLAWLARVLNPPDSAQAIPEHVASLGDDENRELVGVQGSGVTVLSPVYSRSLRLAASLRASELCRIVMLRLVRLLFRDADATTTGLMNRV